MRYLIIMISGFMGLTMMAQNYPVSDIPTEVRKGANAVVRSSHQTFEMIDYSQGTYNIKKVVTILNSDAFGEAVFNPSYTKLMKISGIKLSYFDADGELLKRVKKSDIEDYNVNSSGTLFDDVRLKYYEPEEYDYPFTIAYEYEYDYRTMVGMPAFRPIYSDKLGIQDAQYTAIVPKGYNLRYRGVNGAEDPELTHGEKDSYQWKMSSMAPVDTEYRGLPSRDLAPYVLIQPSDFAMEGYSGNMSDWSSFGEWVGKLKEGRDEISDEVKAEIDALIEGVEDPREKSRLIYKYMQSSTRYVSVQLGIGGFQPFEAMDVIKNGYGDCKALTNYMYSLLKYAGVDSNYVVINAGDGEEDIITDFPSSQFNHVILAVPMEKDTVWLECTSQTTPFNFLGSFTDDRHALLIDDDGKGSLVKTPKYELNQNTQERRIDVEIDKEGNVVADVETIYKGLQYDWIYRLVDRGTDEQRKYFLNAIDLPAFDLGEFSLKEDRTTEDPFVTERITIKARKYASKSGKRIFVTPNFLNRMNAKPPKEDERKSPVVLKTSYFDTDHVNIKMPEGYRLEFDLEDVELKSDFGEYKVTYNFNPDSNTLEYVRTIKMREGKYSAEDYNNYRDFIRKVVKADKAKIVLVGAT
ncbi:DUF3857 domain-containing protein [Roseivirga sp. E12]|uniref:DUF3857 domain-containing protein n=1 Tax=Roseivirga sp. E12 TaxID=2819237 RepID=UPI001ABD1161|nr:DUF3857 domain-containing protein [Roseivirga sp. E12]MBO3699708.1 DUF3857 domain-containing protein [Roseivirga sp. E12]